MASGEEIVKYMTQKMVQYIDTPREERRLRRLQRRNISEPWSTRWFGLIPMAFAMWVSHKFRRNKGKT